MRAGFLSVLTTLCHSTRRVYEEKIRQQWLCMASCRRSFQNLDKWLSELRENTDPSAAWPTTDAGEFTRFPNMLDARSIYHNPSPLSEVDSESKGLSLVTEFQTHNGSPTMSIVSTVSTVCVVFTALQEDLSSACSPSKVVVALVCGLGVPSS